MSDRLASAVAALEKLRDIVADWPTARALNAYGSQRATEKKEAARVIIADALAGVSAEPVLTPEQSEAIGDAWEANTSREFDAVAALVAAVGYERGLLILTRFAKVGGA